MTEIKSTLFEENSKKFLKKCRLVIKFDASSKSQNNNKNWKKMRGFDDIFQRKQSFINFTIDLTCFKAAYKG